MDCCQKASNEYNFCPQCGQKLNKIGNRLGSYVFNLSSLVFVQNNCKYGGNDIDVDLIYKHLFTNECENKCLNGSINIIPNINYIPSRKQILSVNKINFKVEKTENILKYITHMDIEYDLLDFDENMIYNGPIINKNLYLKFNCDINFKHYIYVNQYNIKDIKYHSKIEKMISDIKNVVDKLESDLKKIKISESNNFLRDLGFELIE